MSTLQDIVTAVISGREGSAALEYKRGPHSTGEGDRYEERVLALVFLRCLRHRLLFQLSANNGDAGKFDDVVLVWRPEEDTEAHILCVQLKHKTSSNSMTIHSATLRSEAPNCDFGLGKYSISYGDISKKQDMDRATCVLLTNAHLGDSSLSMFVSQDVDSVPGLHLLQAGGQLYKLNPDSQLVPETVREKASFVAHFYLLCQQRNSDEIVSDICKEVKELLLTGELRGPVSDDLCKELCKKLCESLRQWMNHECVCLTSGWSKWQALVTECVRKEVTDCTVVTTCLKYCNVGDVWCYVESHNPAWVMPPERGTAALSATKVHQALGQETHIVVAVERFTQLQQQIRRCWGPFCRWLVIVDDDKEGNSDILSELVTQTETDRRLIIVSSRGNSSFIDTCQSSDVSDDSWNECLNVNVRLNGDNYECRLRELVAGVDGIKSLLDGEPALLLALARLSQPLRMGQDLETLTAYYLPRKKLGQWLLTDDFFSTVSRIHECAKVQEKEQVEALETTSNIIVVEGRPGVGKSNFLSYVARQIKERVPACWLLRVNLSQFYTILDKSGSAVSAAEDILLQTAFNQNELGRLEYALLRHILLYSPRVVCLVDGFDEVCPDYVSKCLEVLPLLVPSKGKLVVTTRPAQVKLLENRMSVLTHSLEPFSKSELEEFFRNHPSGGKIAPIGVLNRSLRNLLRIPLFAEMFAKLSQEIAERYDIVTLYEAFFRNKIRRLYEEKWGDNFSAPGKKKEFEEALKRH